MSQDRKLPKPAFWKKTRNRTFWTSAALPIVRCCVPTQHHYAAQCAAVHFRRACTRSNCTATQLRAQLKPSVSRHRTFCYSAVAVGCGCRLSAIGSAAQRAAFHFRRDCTRSNCTATQLRAQLEPSVSRHRAFCYSAVAVACGCRLSGIGCRSKQDVRSISEIRPTLILAGSTVHSHFVACCARILEKRTRQRQHAPWCTVLPDLPEAAACYVGEENSTRLETCSAKMSDNVGRFVAFRPTANAEEASDVICRAGLRIGVVLNRLLETMPEDCLLLRTLGEQTKPR